MNGYQITFLTQQRQQVEGRPVADWLMGVAAELGLRGATQWAATQGLDHRHRVHAARFFELADQPVCVMMVVSPEEAERLLARLQAVPLPLFYSKVPAEFGLLGAVGNASPGD